jgi:endonuclease-3 related protein
MRTQADPNLALVYAQLAAAWGPQHWWPGDTPFEVAVGAVLTQNTAWSNVEKAITSLKATGAMTATGLLALSASDLEQAIRPAGYYRVKARYLRTLALWVAQRATGDLSSLASEDTDTLRREILALHGVGRETADSILLYAIGKPAFVVDAYTRRIGARLRLLPENATYESAQQYFIAGLPEDVHLFNEFHALLVRLAKEHCRARPVCLACPLERRCPSADASSATRHAVRVRTMPERRTVP